MFRFELKKLWRRKQFLVISVLIVISIAALFYRNFWMQDEIVNHLLQTNSQHSGSTYALVKLYNDEMDFRSEDGILDELFLENYDGVQLMNENIGYLLSTIENKKWDLMPEVELAFLESVQKYNESGEKYDQFTEEELAQKIDHNRILIENSLPYEHDEYSIATTNFMKVIFMQLLSVQGIAIFVLLFGVLLVMEKEQQTIRTIITQPISKIRLIFGKFFSQMGTIIYSILLLLFVSYFIPLFFGGHKGSFLYPQLVFYEEGFTHISLSYYLLLYIIIFLGVAAFVFSFNLLFSTLFNDRLTVLFYTFTTLFGGIYVTNQFTALQYNWNPFYYFTPDLIIENQQKPGSLLFIIIPYISSLLLLSISVLLQHYKENASKDDKDLFPYGKGAGNRRRFKITDIFTFEKRKLQREGQVKRLAFLLLMLIVGGYWILTLTTNELKKDYLEYSEGALSAFEQYLEETKNDLENNQSVLDELESIDRDLTDSEIQLLENTKSSKSILEQSLFLYEDEVEIKKSILDSFQTKNWSAVYDDWIDEITLWWEGVGRTDNYPTEKGGLSDFTFMASVEQYNWMKEHNLTPVHQKYITPYAWTVYDRFLHPMEQLEWDQDTRKVDHTGLFYMYTFFTTPIFLLLMVMLVFVLGVGMSAEKGIKRTLTFLKTQPLQMSTIHLGKNIISIIIGLMIALGSWFVMILLGSLFNRFGDLKYPVLFYDPPSLIGKEDYSGFIATEGGFHFITMGKYLLETGSLFLIGVIFLIVLSLFLSLFFKQPTTVFVMTAIISATGYFVAAKTKFSTIAHFLPFTYLNIGKIANGELAIVLENEGVTLVMALIILLTATILLIILGWAYSRSRLIRLE